MSPDKPDEEPRLLSDDTEDAFLKAGLRALRDDAPSEHSRQAVLDRLGLGKQAVRRTRLLRRGGVRVVVRGLCLGILLGVGLALLQRWLG